MTQEFIINMLGTAGGVIVAYGAIRADLARISAVAQIALESAEKAHTRIDGIKR